ncbi:MAG: formate C-acetyltransferase/glycerol dehydratase family glycyl radical enzyme [Phycisphaerales bacterium]|jgi:pyruvate formate-lyase/glycerol dehydratase family glycyl radical enzyme|nr:formate C-acetyltransferase/glycerol dehydratase family glycyl radical enzyme [Phycisphaerales bacterium]MBT7170915.1 formate C-acetyltransferase/glycerol dehydratase family glycyl radical enzyme [Phycisphaerales bacterium]
MQTTPFQPIIKEVLPEGSAGSQRIQRMRQRVVNVQPEVCLERARIATRVYKANEHLSPLPLRTKTFDAVLREMSLLILDDELIVGHQSSKHRSAPLFPEFAVEWINDEIETFYTRAQDKFYISDEDIQTFREEIYPYWTGKTFKDKMMTYMSEEVRKLRFDAGLISVGVHEESAIGHVLLDYQKILTHGFSGVKATIQEKIDALTSWKAEDLRAKQFYDACLSVCDSVIAFARRYSELATQLAEAEADPKRKAELLEIAKVCARVPEFPAETFHEALQSFWFIQIVTQIYDNGVSISPGRFDQYMLPYYTQDIESGLQTKESAQELLEAMWVKFCEPIKIYCAEDAAFHAGYPMGQNLIISGLLPDGNDGTNELSYRCLEAHSHLVLSQPNFSVRLHSKSPIQFVQHVCEAIRKGNGMPQIVNDDIYVPAMMNLGVPLADARDYTLVGCVEISPRHTWGRCNGGYLNLSKVLELTLFNGRCGISDKQVSIETGDPTSFDTFEKFVEAFTRQMNYCMEKLVEWDNLIDMVHAENMPIPLHSILVDDCIETGTDVLKGGARYNWTGPLGVGIANVGDSLYTLKKAIYQDKTFTMEQLVRALETDFDGEEVMRQTLINRVDKYGNDLDGPDQMVKRATDIFFDSMLGYETYRGGPFTAALLPVAAYVAFGLATAALPDGKKKYAPLADGISPTSGADIKGPTAAMRSICAIDHVRCGNGVIFNQKISPTAVSTPEGIAKWANMIMGYIALGGGHVQFNIVDAETLRSAMIHPEEHKGLVVRVAGYSAFFNELAPEIQESIIARTEHTLA